VLQKIIKNGAKQQHSNSKPRHTHKRASNSSSSSSSSGSEHDVTDHLTPHTAATSTTVDSSTAATAAASAAAAAAAAASIDSGSMHGKKHSALNTLGASLTHRARKASSSMLHALNNTSSSSSSSHGGSSSSSSSRHGPAYVPLLQQYDDTPAATTTAAVVAAATAAAATATAAAATAADNSVTGTGPVSNSGDDNRSPLLQTRPEPLTDSPIGLQFAPDFSTANTDHEHTATSSVVDTLIDVSNSETVFARGLTALERASSYSMSANRSGELSAELSAAQVGSCSA
jgi:trimeric autotransporter adhesin